MENKCSIVFQPKDKYITFICRHTKACKCKYYTKISNDTNRCIYRPKQKTSCKNEEAKVETIRSFNLLLVPWMFERLEK